MPDRESREQPAGDCRGDEGIATHRRVQRLHHPGRRGALEQEPARAVDVLVGVERRHDHDPQRRVQPRPGEQPGWPRCRPGAACGCRAGRRGGGSAQPARPPPARRRAWATTSTPSCRPSTVAGPTRTISWSSAASTRSVIGWLTPVGRCACTTHHSSSGPARRVPRAARPPAYRVCRARRPGQAHAPHRRRPHLPGVSVVADGHVDRAARLRLRRHLRLLAARRDRGRAGRRGARRRARDRPDVPGRRNPFRPPPDP